MHEEENKGKANSPNYNTRGPWDNNLANDSTIFSLIWVFKAICIYEWSPPVKHTHSPIAQWDEHVVTSMWGIALLIASVYHALVLWLCYGNEVIPHLSQWKILQVTGIPMRSVLNVRIAKMLGKRRENT